ncbi:AN1-type zinc finger protein 1 isoform X2 [Colius striatus]|uniref:AN1-type zinc finger protein 1 isoform X2 n=1 Tax=Colius striatus TaxID=57412 RepID=UPI002B1D732D|nr:AN1-type zinc finger protein 1 isoform X2 [Colius striatus]
MWLLKVRLHRYGNHSGNRLRECKKYPMKLCPPPLRLPKRAPTAGISRHTLFPRPAATQRVESAGCGLTGRPERRLAPTQPVPPAAAAAPARPTPRLRSSPAPPCGALRCPDSPCAPCLCRFSAPQARPRLSRRAEHGGAGGGAALRRGRVPPARLQHRSRDAHRCSEVNMRNNSVKLDQHRSYPCSYKDCNGKELLPVLCPYCEKHFCLKHRHQSDHECEKLDTPKPRMAATQQLVQHIIDSKKNEEAKSKKRKGAKNSETAAKVALMKLKMHASGDKSLPQVSHAPLQ